jgi:hypothetical protein
MMVRILTIFLLLSSSSLTNAQSISVNKACVAVGETFAVTFQNKNELDSDWIGIIPANENTQSFSTIGTWVWTCGSQTCSGAVAMGRVRLRAGSLATGTWRAVLARDDATAPFSAYAKSSTFTIATSCSSSPVGSPVRSPVAAPTSGNANAVALSHINSARSEIEGLIRNDKRLAPQFLRMGFHDCIGGCDGMCALFVRVYCGLLLNYYQK